MRFNVTALLEVNIESFWKSESQFPKKTKRTIILEWMKGDPIL